MNTVQKIMSSFGLATLIVGGTTAIINHNNHQEGGGVNGQRTEKSSVDQFISNLFGTSVSSTAPVVIIETDGGNTPPSPNKSQSLSTLTP